MDHLDPSLSSSPSPVLHSFRLRTGRAGRKSWETFARASRSGTSGHDHDGPSGHAGRSRTHSLGPRLRSKVQGPVGVLSSRGTAPQEPGLLRSCTEQSTRTSLELERPANVGPIIIHWSQGQTGNISALTGPMDRSVSDKDPGLLVEHTPDRPVSPG